MYCIGLLVGLQVLCRIVEITSEITSTVGLFVRLQVLCSIVSEITSNV